MSTKVCPCDFVDERSFIVDVSNVEDAGPESDLAFSRLKVDFPHSTAAAAARSKVCQGRDNITPCAGGLHIVD